MSVWFSSRTAFRFGPWARAGTPFGRAVFLRLKELESMKEIASHIHEVRVVVGADGLKTLLPAGLLNDGSGKREAK